ncbi:MAG: Ldh family oxidoreductase [Anaerolineae bacterium]
MYICKPEPLEAFIEEIVIGLGADEEIATEVAQHLVHANLSGHDSHGVLRIAQYTAQADSGELVPAAQPTILRESSTTALIDARRGFGHYSTAYALNWAMKHAHEHGIAAAAVRHSSHIGRVGEYTERAAQSGLIAIVTVGSAGRGVGGLVPFGGRQRFFGANPWSMGVPAREQSPMVYDGSSATVAEGKVRFARAKGAPLPPGCIQDSEGKPTTDPEDFYDGGALLPLGGEVAGHKGYGLAMASALIGGLSMIGDEDHTLIGASVVEEVDDTSDQIAGVFLMVIDPAFFGDAEHYRAMVDETLTAAKNVEPAEGFDEVLIPGEPEVNTRRGRSQKGIAIPDATWEDFEALAERFGLSLPAHHMA